MSKRSLISSLADAVVWIDNEASKLKDEIKEKVKEFLEFADDQAERLENESENVLKALIKGLRERLKEIEEELEKSYEEKTKEELNKVDRLAKENLEKAVKEVEEAIINILTGGAGS